MQTTLQTKRAMSIALLVLLFGAVGMNKGYAQMFTVDNLNYTVNYGSNTVTLKGHVDGTAATGTLVIPSTITYDGTTYTVTMIAREAFKDCRGLTGNLIIPNTVTTIGDESFNGCEGFNGSLTLGNSVIEIGQAAFKDCKGFTGNLVIPNSVLTIRGGGVPYYYDECVGAFSNCNGFNGTLTLGNSITSIERCAFSGCSNFSGNLTIPNSVTSIGEYAFANCSGFNGHLTLSNSIVKIAEGVFVGCSGFTGDLVIPNSVNMIEGFIDDPYPCGAFENCTGFNGTLILSNSLTEIQQSAFYGCNGFTGNLVIPNSVTRIGNSAFGHCSGFNGTLSISNLLRELEDGAFYGCSGFTGDIILPYSISERIGSLVFYNCSGFNGNLFIPEVSSIGRGAFYNCSGLTSITVCNDNPPEIEIVDWDDNHAFDGVNKSIPVYVPCNAVPQYQIASYWDEFYNYHETFLNTIHLNVYADDEEHCTVSIEQMPSSCESNLATIKAVPANGYSFVAWMEWNNNTYEYDTISTDAVYSFNLEYDRYLVAHVKSNTGITEDSEAEIEMYPNPTNGQFKIEANHLKRISISNLIGQQILESDANSDVFEYDFGKYDAGVYLVRIETTKGVDVKKVLVTR